MKKTSPQLLPKPATGIEGFDDLSRGGMPRSRTSLVIGAPGAGKTVFSLQYLVNGIRERQKSGIFVAFEESPNQIIANGATFDWGLAALPKNKFFLLDACLSPAAIQSGEFDRAGMLAMLMAKTQEIGVQIKFLQADLQRQQAALTLYAG